MSGRWVCLVYHDVLPRKPALNGSPEYFGVSRRAFLEQLDLIGEEGLVGCSLEEALARGGAGCVAITFDDGEVGQYTQAVPALRERGMTATFFIVTNWVGRPGYVTWEQLRDMRAAGMSVQSHTASHAYLSELSPERARTELTESKAVLDRRLEQETTQIALPGGFEPPRRLWPLLEEAGYRVVATSRWGLNGAGTAPGLRRVNRCWAQGEPPADHFRRVLRGDPRLAAQQWVRRLTLDPVKGALGASRYLRWRERFLNAVGGEAGGGERDEGSER